MTDAGPPAGAVLRAEFYDRPAEEVARDLLGSVLVSTIGGAVIAGRIVETEAYAGPHDPASHAAEHIGRTPRNAPMFGAPGTAYVYLIYGIHWCLNVVTGPEGYPAAALIRALEPLTGLPVARERRGRARPDRDLMSGPGRLSQALGIAGKQDGHALFTPPLWIGEGRTIADHDVVTGPRIGVSRARDWPLRYRIRDSIWVSPRSP